MTTFTAAVTLFMIMDPIGNIPLFLSALKSVAPERRNFVLIRELLISLAVLVVILFLGQHLLSLLNLRQESVSVAGGIVLFLIAIRMVFPPEKVSTDQVDGEPFIVPLAVPLLAGPSAIATLLLFMQRQPERMLDWLTALFIAWLVTAAILLCSNFFYRLLRDRGLIAMERLMGMILVAVAVQMFLDGAKEYLRQH